MLFSVCGNTILLMIPLFLSSSSLGDLNSPTNSSITHVLDCTAKGASVCQQRDLVSHFFVCCAGSFAKQPLASGISIFSNNDIPMPKLICVIGHGLEIVVDLPEATAQTSITQNPE